MYYKIINYCRGTACRALEQAVTQVNEIEFSNTFLIIRVVGTLCPKYMKKKRKVNRSK